MRREFVKEEERFYFLINAANIFVKVFLIIGPKAKYCSATFKTMLNDVSLRDF